MPFMTGLGPVVAKLEGLGLGAHQVPKHLPGGRSPSRCDPGRPMYVTGYDDEAGEEARGEEEELVADGGGEKLEALIAMRDVKMKLQEVRRDRGFGCWTTAWWRPGLQEKKAFAMTAVSRGTGLVMLPVGDLALDSTDRRAVDAARELPGPELKTAVVTNLDEALEASGAHEALAGTMAQDKRWIRLAIEPSAAEPRLGPLPPGDKVEDGPK